MKFNLLNYPLYQLELLQLENYELGRFWSVIRITLGAPGETRQTVVWTAKAKAIAAVASVLQFIASAALTAVIINFIGFSLIAVLPVYIIVYIGLLGFFFVFLSGAVLILSPVDSLAKNSIIEKAKKRITSQKNLTVIGIAGSYGKTTMKEVVASVLSEKYNVIKTPESINTPLGIARLVLDELSADTQVFVVELGEHYPGDITTLCQLVQPAIGIITGINESHLDRFGSIENTVATIFELAENMKSDGTLVLNADDNLVVEHYKKYIKDQSLQFFSSENSTLAKYQIKKDQFDSEKLVRSFTLQIDDEQQHFTTSLLGHYIIGDVIAASIVGTKLGLTDKNSTSGVEKLQPVPHRLQPMPSPAGVTVIDDSYNGNPQGVKEAIEVLSQFANRRKIFLTPGLVEMGAKSQEIHYNIGKQLAPVANIVILIRNSVTGFIEKGLLDEGFDKEQIIWFDSATKAHSSLGSILKPTDVILFQNDWTDNYI